MNNTSFFKAHLNSNAIMGTQPLESFDSWQHISLPYPPHRKKTIVFHTHNNPIRTTQIKRTFRRVSPRQLVNSSRHNCNRSSLNHPFDLNRKPKRNFSPIPTRVHQYVFNFQKACFLGKRALNKLSKRASSRPMVKPKIQTTIPSHRPPTALLKSIHSSLHCCPY